MISVTSNLKQLTVSRVVTVFLSEGASVGIRLTPNMQSMMCTVTICTWYCMNLLVEVSSDRRGSIGAAQLCKSQLK